MKLFFAVTTVLMLTACGLTPAQSRYLMEQINDANANQPKRTYCTRVGDQMFCETR